MRWLITPADGAPYVFDDFGAADGEDQAAGLCGPGASYAPDAPPVDPYNGVDAGTRIRIERAGLLAASDWTQLPDSPLSTEKREAWRFYRQSLRDLPAVADLSNVIWPEAPE